MVGSAVVRCLKRYGFSNLLVRKRSELDLTEQFAVKKFFTECQPEAIILCAAKVGGIIANQQLPADFIGQNLLIQSNVISTACETGIESLMKRAQMRAWAKISSMPEIQKIREDKQAGQVLKHQAGKGNAPNQNLFIPTR